MNKIKKFFRDYWSLSKLSLAFWREHFVGMTLLTAAASGIGYLIGVLIERAYERREEKRMLEENNKYYS